MPELPEVETIARTLRKPVQGAVITNAQLLRPSSLHSLSLPLESLNGYRIASVRRRGKLLLLDLDSTTAKAAATPCNHDLLLAFHLRMTGRLTVQQKTTTPGAYTRCIFDLCAADGNACRLFFDDVRAFGLILAATPATLEQWPFWRQLGPEPLTLTAEEFSARLNGKKTAIKAALLDQKVLAGIGNIYADESLFAARLDPRRPSHTLTFWQRQTLLASIKDILLLAIDQCGSSIRDYRDANGNAGAFQNSFAVYGRAGKPCQICQRPLTKIRVAGRGTVYCPHCQK